MQLVRYSVFTLAENKVKWRKDVKIMSVWFRIKETSLKYRIFMGIPVKCETKRNKSKRNSPKRNEIYLVSFRFGKFRFVSFRILQVPKKKRYKLMIGKRTGSFWSLSSFILCLLQMTTSLWLLKSTSDCLFIHCTGICDVHVCIYKEYRFP
jgi:hypothetical protein